MRVDLTQVRAWQRIMRRIAVAVVVVVVVALFGYSGLIDRIGGVSTVYIHPHTYQHCSIPLRFHTVSCILSPIPAGQR